MIVGILRFSRYLLKVRVTKLRATFGWRGVACVGVIRFSALSSAFLCLLCGCCGLGLLFGCSRDD